MLLRAMSLAGSAYRCLVLVYCALQLETSSLVGRVQDMQDHLSADAICERAPLAPSVTSGTGAVRTEYLPGNYTTQKRIS